MSNHTLLPSLIKCLFGEKVYSPVVAALFIEGLKPNVKEHLDLTMKYPSRDSLASAAEAAELKTRVHSGTKYQETVNFVAQSTNPPHRVTHHNNFQHKRLKESHSGGSASAPWCNNCSTRVPTVVNESSGDKRYCHQ